MARPQRSSIQIDSRLQPQLQAVAFAAGYRRTYKGQEQGNVKAFVEAIARGDCAIASPMEEPTGLDPEGMLARAIAHAADLSRAQAEQLLSALGLAESSALDRFWHRPVTDRERKIDDCIRHRTPFRLTGQAKDAQIPWQCDFQFAEWWFYRGKLRLRGWSPSNRAANTEPAPLDCNWHLTSAGWETAIVEALEGVPWHDGLARIEVTFAIAGGAGDAYERYVDAERDESRDRLPWKGSTVLRVRRPVWSLFWLRQELQPYFPNVAVLEPDAAARWWQAQTERSLRFQAEMAANDPGRSG